MACKGDVLHQVFESLLPMDYDAFAIFDADNLPDPAFMQVMNDALAAGERVCKGRLKAGNAFESWVSGGYGLYHALMEWTYSRPHSAAGFSSNLVGTAFVASLLRNLLGLGSLMAFPGSMCGALLCGVVYHKTHKLLPTLVGEVFGTGIIGGLLAWPVAILFMGKAAGDVAFYAYIVPFLISTVGGSIIAGVILFALEKNGTLKKMQNSLDR